MPAIAKTQPNTRLKDAVRSSGGLSRQSILESAFAYAFRGLVYPQIWEDPQIDMEALAITPECHILAIASGGCNILSYLTADPSRITAVDLNTAHIALNKLKLSAAENLPSWSQFYTFFGEANTRDNVDSYWRFIAPHLDADSRTYWERRGMGGIGRRRIAMFSPNLYRYGLLGTFIGMGHLLARSYGVDPRDALRARTLEEQRAFFDTAFAPLFDKGFIRWATTHPASLYGLGIPPAQHTALGGGHGMANVLRERLEKLTCDFSFGQNYFAWQAFARRYSKDIEGPLPPYLQRENFDKVRSRVRRVDVLNRSLTEHLNQRPAQSLDRYVLLDAQDWMTADKMNALWREITRTAKPGARVIFRTAAVDSPLPKMVESETLQHWVYEAEASKDYTARDRSAIYGGFHLYVVDP